MKTLSFQVSWDLWAKLRQTLHALESTNPPESESPTLRALCTALIQDGLQHRKIADISKLTHGHEIKQGRPRLSFNEALLEKNEKLKEETYQQRAKRLHGWDLK